MGIPARADGRPGSQGFPNLPQTFIYPLTHPGSAATLALDGLKPNHSSHLPTQSLGPTPTHPEAKTPHTHTLTPTPKCQATARRGQAGMDPAGPSLEEASCGAGLVGRLCQKA